MCLTKNNVCFITLYLISLFCHISFVLSNLSLYTLSSSININGTHNNNNKHNNSIDEMVNLNEFSESINKDFNNLKYNDDKKSSYQILYDKINTNNLPIFEFSKEFSKIYNDNENNDNLELYNLYNYYLSQLRDFYLDMFITLCKDCSNIQALRIKIIAECTSAMKASIPKLYKSTINVVQSDLSMWSYEGTIEELHNDIQQYTDQLSSYNSNNNHYNNNHTSSSSSNILMVPQTSNLQSGDHSKDTMFPRFWMNAKWRKRSKWILAQLLLVGLNFIQYDVQRRLSIRAAEKRLAEVPEFPLL